MSRLALSSRLLATGIAILTLAAATAPNPDPEPLKVPTGRPVLLDGRVAPDEWSDAREIPAAPTVRLYLKRDDRFLYVAVAPAAPALFGVNLYLDVGRAPEYLNLHASAKLGERWGRAEAWPEWTWWNNEGWTANVGRFDSFEPRRFLPDSGKEFQISLARLGGREVSLSLDLESREGTTPLLADAPRRDGLHWVTLQL